MQYHNGSTVMLGDFVNVPVPGGTAKARVVMLGETYEHLDIDEKFLAWVKRDKVLEPSSIVIEWVDGNPFAHEDPRYAPVGNYMFSPVDEWVTRDTNLRSNMDAQTAALAPRTGWAPATARWNQGLRNEGARAPFGLNWQW